MARASVELRGAPLPLPPLELECCWLGGLAAGEESRATVTRGLNIAHSLALSFTGIRSGIGFKH